MTLEEIDRIIASEKIVMVHDDRDLMKALKACREIARGLECKLIEAESMLEDDSRYWCEQAGY